MNVGTVIFILIEGIGAHGVNGIGISGAQIANGCTRPRVACASGGPYSIREGIANDSEDAHFLGARMGLSL